MCDLDWFPKASHILVNTFVVYAAVFNHRLSINHSIYRVGCLHELASLPEKIEDTQECQHIYYCNRLAMYYCTYNRFINMYFNSLLLDNFITFSVTYHMISMELKFMSSLEIFI